MPIVRREDWKAERLIASPEQLPERPKATDPEFSSSVKAGFIMENPITAGIAIGTSPLPSDIETTFKPAEYLRDNDMLDDLSPNDLAEIIGTSSNKEDLYYNLDRIKRKNEIAKDAQGFGYFLGAVGTQVVNPYNYVGGTGLLRSGKSALATIGRALSTEVPAQTLSELDLHQINSDRTLMESTINIAASGLIASSLGVLKHTLSDSSKETVKDIMRYELKQELKKLELTDEEVLDGIAGVPDSHKPWLLDIQDNLHNEVNLTTARPPEAESAGAAAVTIPKMTDVEMLDFYSIAGVPDNLLKAVSPTGFMSGSYIQAKKGSTGLGRMRADMLYKNDIETNGTRMGVAKGNSVEGLIDLDSAKMLMNRRRSMVNMKAALKNNKEATLDEINEDAVLLMADPSHTPRFKETASIVKEYSEHMKELWDMNRKTFPTEPDSVSGYFTHGFSPDEMLKLGKVKSSEVMAEAMHKYNLKLELPAVPVKPSSDAPRWQVKEYEKALAEYEEIKWLMEADDIKIQQAAEEAVEKILSPNLVESIRGLTTSGGRPTKARGLRVDTKDILPLIHKDIHSVYSNYVHSMSTSARMKQVLEEYGFESPKDYLDQLAIKYDELIAKAQAKGEKPRVINKLIKERKKELLSAQDDFRIITGSFADPNDGIGSQLLKNLKRYTTMTLLSNGAISSLPDFAMAPFRHGFIDTFEKGYKQFMSNLDLTKMSVRDLQELNIATEHVNNLQLQILQDGGFRNAGATIADDIWGKMDKLGDKATNGFGRMSGMTYSTNIGKALSGVISQNRLFKSIEDWVTTGKLDVKETRRLHALGISETDAKYIWDEFKKYGETKKGGYFADFRRWDKDTREKVAHALNTEVHSTVITPSKGDIPKWAMKNEVNKAIFHFKSFMAGSTSKILIKGLQKRDAAVAQGVIAAIALGMMSQAIKSALRGENYFEDFEENWYKKVMQGLSSSGVLGLALTTLTDLAGAGRYAEQTFASTVLGPALPMIYKNYGLIHNIIDDLAEGGEITPATIAKARRLTPFAGIPYIKKLSDAIAD